MNTIKMNDIFEVSPEKALVDLKKADKFKLMDSLLQEGDRPKGLDIEFGLSASGRRTNNRIYTPKGQRAGISTWMEPYPKAIIRNHDINEDPLGRFTNVRWVSLDNESMGSFKRVQDYMAVKDALESDNPKRIYNALRKNNLLTSNKWRGTGELLADAAIYDEDAIEKFLDGRYLTFSAGSSTDRWVCSACLSDWASGDVCDHRPGTITDEGELVVVITGTFLGREASVLNTPAHDFSTVRSMQFGDSLKEYNNEDCFLTDPSTIYLTDSSIIDVGDMMSVDKKTVEQLVEEFKAMDARDVARGILSGSFTPEQNDALEAASHYETAWLVRVHDALHNQYDWEVRYSGEDLEIPRAVFKMHGDLHALADQKGFRDSIMNGALDKFNSAGKESEEYVMKTDDTDQTPSEVERFTEVLRQVVAADPTILDGLIKPEPKGEPEVKPEPVIEDEAGAKPDPVIEDEAKPAPVDWTLLDMALSYQLEAKALSADDREALSEESFQGPDRKFPLHDREHAEAARELLEKVTLPESVRKELEDKIESLLVVDDAAALAELRTQHDALQADYEASLKRIQTLEAKLKTPEVKPEPVVKTDDKTDPVEPKAKIDDKGSLENPSAASGQPDGNKVVSFDKLDDYQKSVVTKYLALADSSSAKAESFLWGLRQRGYIPPSFDITQYIQEND